MLVYTPYKLEDKQHHIDTSSSNPTETSSTDGYEAIDSEEEQVEHTEQQVHETLSAKAQQQLCLAQPGTTATHSDEEDSSDEEDTRES